jgi:hypothetical protein
MRRANTECALLAGWLLASALVAGSLLASPCAAQSYDGVWRAGVTTMDVAVESWGGDCGPRPVTSRSEGGGNVQITQEPPHLVIHGKDSQIRTDRCWSRNPAIKRRSSSYLDGVWLTQCRTDPDDPRAEQGTYSLKSVSPDQLLYKDVSKYNWKLNTSACIATITTTQMLNRAGSGAATGQKAPPPPPLKAPPPPPQPPPEPEEEEEEEEEAPSASACTPGAPSRLVLRPQRASVQVGGRLCLRAKLTDASGCRIPEPAIEWSLQHSHALRGSLEGGCFRAGDSAAEAEGEFTVVASVGALSARSVLDVQSVDLSALIARRLETGAVSGFDEAPAEATTTTAAKVATRRVDERSGGGGNLLLGIGGLAALGLLVLIGLRLRARKQPTLSPDSDSGSESKRPARTGPAPARAPAPAAGGTAAGRPASAATVVGAPGQAAPAPAAAPTAANDGQQWICPSCRRGWPATQGKCPNDGTALLPYAEFVKQRDQAQHQRLERSCPKCGKQYPAGVGFCSEDGTRLG